MLLLCVIYSARPVGGAQGGVWFDMKGKPVFSSLNGFLTHNLSNVVLSKYVLFIRKLAIFFLISRLLAPGVLITYRKLISYTRLRGSHLLHRLLWQEWFHTAGPQATAWDYWFSQELTDLIAANCSRICQVFPADFPPWLCLHATPMSTSNLQPLKDPTVLQHKDQPHWIQLLALLDSD